MSTSLSVRWPGIGLTSLNKVWDNFFDGHWSAQTLTVPQVNVTESDKSYSLSLAAPGFSKGDFKIEVDNNTLTVSSEKEESKEESDKSYTRKEYNYNSFSRSFSLPEEVEQSEIEAKYEDGILKLELPKSKKAENKKTTTINVK